MASIVHLLPDEPTTQDGFGTHSRVANAVSELIKNEKPDKAIALIGPWGSGKSSVLQMVQARLAGVADVFIFDAWTHEGDPLRRTFLEGLITFLWPDYPSPETKALLDEIKARKKTKEETTTPVLTWEARALGVFLLMVPAGLAMFAAMVRMKDPSWPLVGIALFLSLLPLLFVVVLSLGVGLRKTVLALSRRPWTSVSLAITGSILLAVIAYLYRIPFAQYARSRLILLGLPVLVAIVLAIYRSSAAGILPLLLNRTVTTTRSETVESSEPSSVELQRWFRSVVTMHSKDQSRSLVIAIDNLDRIDRGRARQLWATMRTFFEFRSEARQEMGRIWLLAAFDKEAIEGLWPSDDADSFIRKTFQASFAVPSLVLIHRDDYLKKQLRLAFPSWADGILDPIVRLYALKHATEISTPRHITSFVNAVGSIHRQWRVDEIPLINQAQYVLVADNSSDIMSILTSASTASWSPEELVGSNWQESLAAIHFNVPPNEVAHVFMPPPITEGLISGDSNKFSSLMRMRGFSGVLSDVMIRNKEAWKQPQTLANAVIALDSLGDSNNDDGLARSWRLLSNAAARIEKWDPLPHTARALAILIRRESNDNSQIKRLLESAGRAIPRTPGGAVDDSDRALAQFVITLTPVFELLLALPQSFEMVIYGSAVTYLKLLSTLQAEKPNEFAEMAGRLGSESRGDIPLAVAESIKNVRVMGHDWAAVRVVSAHYSDLNWQPVTQAAEGLFSNTNNNFLQGGFQATFKVLMILASSNAVAVKSLEKLARDGTLYHYLGVVEDPDSKDLARLMLLLFADGSEPAGFPGSARQGVAKFLEWLQNPDAASVGAVAALASVFDHATRLKSRAEVSDSANENLSAVLRLIVSRPEFSSVPHSLTSSSPPALRAKTSG